MKHAYLIIAHTGWKQLSLLIRLLDIENNHIYIHIDKKAKNVHIDKIMEIPQKSQIFIFQKYKVYWGSFKLVQVELLLFKEASKKHYEYYHLLSGSDLPIKPITEICKFFEINKGFEFIHFDTDERIKADKEIKRRTKLYHFLQDYRRRYKVELLNQFFTFLERILLIVQIIIKINRVKGYDDFEIKYGSQWVSITDDLVNYIIKQEELIYKIFQYTNCADELFIQTIVHNSEFKNRLWHKSYNDSILANMRLIDMKNRGKNGNPYTWCFNDLNEITSSDCLFARKFNLEVDEQIVNIICGLLVNKVRGVL